MSKKSKSKKAKCPECKGTGTYRNGRNGPMLNCTDCHGSGEKHKFEMFFWHYGQFPFVLAGEGFMEDDGYAFIPSYNQKFKPFQCLPLKEGRVLKEKLAALEDEYNETLKTHVKGFGARLKLICPKAIKD